MNIDNHIEFIKSTVFHELGHLTGYCLANKFVSTKLGNVKSFEIGFLKNCVVPESSFYHIELDLLKEMDRLKNATKNVPRTVAWFVEVIFGCTFQSIIEKKPFQNCFGFGQNFDGHIDFSNLSIVRNVSNFMWNFDEIYELQSEIEKSLIDENFVQNLEPIANTLLEKIREKHSNQIHLNQSEMKELVEKIDKNISEKLITEYKRIIDKYSFRFSTEPDFVAELKYRKPDESGNSKSVKSGYKTSFKFDFSEIQTLGSQRFIRRNFAQTGETVLAEIKIDSTDFLKKNLKNGAMFDFREGSNIIGFGKIIKILNKDLERKNVSHNIG